MMILYVVVLFFTVGEIECREEAFVLIEPGSARPLVREREEEREMMKGEEEEEVPYPLDIQPG